MKKILAVLLVLAMVLSLTACGKSNDGGSSKDKDSSKTEKEDKNSNSDDGKKDSDTGKTDDGDKGSSGSGSGVIIGYTRDKQPTGEGSQAQKWWHASHYSYDSEFDKDGKHFYLVIDSPWDMDLEDINLNDDVKLIKEIKESIKFN